LKGQRAPNFEKTTLAPPLSLRRGPCRPFRSKPTRFPERSGVFGRKNRLSKPSCEICGLAENIAQREAALRQERQRFEAAKVDSKIALERISKEKAMGFPWLASACSEYLRLYDLKVANDLENKDHPARRAAEEIRAMAAQKAELRRENKILRELHHYYESLFPWLIEFTGEDLDELIRQVNQPKADPESNDDPAAQWLSDAEQESAKLTHAEKFQRALDRYWQSKKSPWQLGRDYERYIGYLHDKEGFKVEYHGIEFGYEDLGRDLICSKDSEIRIVQCKYWGAYRTLHEKHVCQIFGTAAAYSRRHAHQKELFRTPPITPWLYVSCAASPTAKEFAQMLGVKLMDNFPFRPYPIIKCNVSLRDGSKIYHLPFDQQYDRTLIEYKDECYVRTVAEAEALGFRRAYRWRGTKRAQD
jgi:hypothetical protein